MATAIQQSEPFHKRPERTLSGYLVARADAFFVVTPTNSTSLMDAELMSTLASAPSTAARAKAEAVVRSDFMFGFSDRAQLLRQLAKFMGALRHACFSTTSMMASPSADSRACLYAHRAL